tara:strand:- start:200 stop:379 length:180 start_codon:yes stop_codon:yes gene_type:complete
MEASLQITKEKQMEETNWRKQVSFLLYELANHGIDSTQFKECLEHLQAKHDEWIFNNGN